MQSVFSKASERLYKPLKRLVGADIPEGQISRLESSSRRLWFDICLGGYGLTLFDFVAIGVRVFIGGRFFFFFEFVIYLDPGLSKSPKSLPLVRHVF